MYKKPTGTGENPVPIFSVFPHREDEKQAKNLTLYAFCATMGNQRNEVKTWR